MPRVFAYCRVSTHDQTTDNQTQEIAAAGFIVEPQRAIAETVSGSVPASERPGFRQLLNKLERGDVLVVTKLDRLGRNAMDVRATVESLAQEGIRVHCLALGGVDLSSPAGRMTMGVIAAVAEFERDLLVERTPEQSSAALQRLYEGGSVASVARELGTSRQTIMRVRDNSAAATALTAH
jgi:putative DNA-invertase from lambdoid prophage Rac